MKYPLRTLGQVQHFRRATAGKLGAEQVAVCGNPNCGTKFHVRLEEAMRELGDNATAEDLKGELNCPSCTDGKADMVYIVIDDVPLGRSIYFPGLFDKYLDTTDIFAAARPPRRRR
jgi:hypothetical protein